MAKPHNIKRRSIVGAMVGEEDRLDELEVKKPEAPKAEPPAGQGAPAEAEVAEVDPPAGEGAGAGGKHEHSPGEQSHGAEELACPRCGTATSPLETNLPLPDSRNPDRNNPSLADERASRQKRLERLMVRMTPEDREDWKLLAEAERLTESSLAYMAIREYMSARRHLVDSAKSFRSALRKTG